LGAFVEGYSLLVCKPHVLSTAALAHEVIAELEELLAVTIERLSEVYQTGIVVFEHGSMSSVCHAGSCVTHQHLHLIPAHLPDLPKKLETQFEKIPTIKLLSDLLVLQASQTPYIWYRTSIGASATYKAPILPRQYMRQVIAAELGGGYEWDWRREPYMDNIRNLVDKIGRAHV